MKDPNRIVRWTCEIFVIDAHQPSGQGYSVSGFSTERPEAACQDALAQVEERIAQFSRLREEEGE